MCDIVSNYSSDIGRWVSYLDGSVMAPTDEPHLVASNRPDTLEVPEEGTHGLARVNVPQFDRIVEAARNE